MKKFKVLFVIFIIILGTVLFFWSDLMDFYSELSKPLLQIQKGVEDFLIQETEKEVFTPPPLRASKEEPESFLTQSGVIQWTNIQREKYGLPPLKEVEKLDISAKIKIQDMFKKQYFAHYSPSGIGVGDLAEGVGYEFIAIGENLALGNFRDDQSLVQAWMDSPGHRENILNVRYQEIGVAVIKGMFEGKTTWLAVQHFGLPLSACLQPNEAFKIKIESNQNEIEELQKTLERLQIEIQAIKPKHGQVYNQKVKRYNVLVSEYNVLVEETKILINKYNNQVKLFNECAVGLE